MFEVFKNGLPSIDSCIYALKETALREPLAGIIPPPHPPRILPEVQGNGQKRRFRPREVLFRAALLAGGAKKHFPSPESTFLMVFRAIWDVLARLERIPGAGRRNFRMHL